MPGRGAERRAEPIKQLNFDTLATLPASDSSTILPGKQNGIATAASDVATALRGEVYRPAPPVRRKTKPGTRLYLAKKHAPLPEGIQQATLEDLFTFISRDADIPRTITISETWRDVEPSGHLQQLSFDSLAKLPADDARAVPAKKPATTAFDALLMNSPLSFADIKAIAKGDPLFPEVAANEGSDVPAGKPAGSNGTAIQRSDVRTDSGEDDALPERLIESATAIPSARRRIILDEPEPEIQPSRDFRITEAHGVGLGGLHEKANANIAAIRLVKTLEAENRDATNEEKAILVRYCGWGALAGVFEVGYRRKPEWNAVATDLEQLLTSEEYESARATTPNAHFTSPLVIQAIWDGLEKLGLGENIEVLEPAMGIGHFFGCMPEAMNGGHRTGVELDSITARIAKKLYPDTTIFAQGFEETQLPDNYFDAVVGNVPFGDYAVHDPAIKHSLTRSIHDYFFAKSVEKTRPGGIMALITSRYTMDKVDTTIRNALAEKADLVAAIRLPNTAFKGNAGTEVTTDILFLKKRPIGAAPAGEQWTETEPIELEGRAIALNEYYVHHPEMMLGQLTLQGTMYRDKEPSLAGEVTEDSLRQAIAALPESVYIPRDQSREPIV